jgi:hypothetical protein
MAAAQNAVKRHLPVNSETALTREEVAMDNLMDGTAMMDSRL